MSRKLLIFLVILVAGVALDQFTKFLVVRELAFGDQVPVITGFFNIVLTYNTGAAFGLFANLSMKFAWAFFIVSTSVVMAVVAFLWWRLPESQDLAAIGYSLIFTGAVGNLLDRLRLGKVVDFLDFHVGQWHWPAFNVADSLVCIGAGLLLWFILQEEQRQDVSNPV
jgi:signal peptidase II|uniref:Lipoprotein signal peptidase n=1 Tax=Desulfobacca acetoxidans TaxID=60893 RepID=A0A7V6A675_9BACT